MWFLALAVGCIEGVGAPEGGPPRVEARPATQALGWVRQIATDGSTVAWSSYDFTKGTSDRATIDVMTLPSGARRELAEERHPPAQIAVHGGYVWWHYRDGGLKRVPVGGGEVERLVERLPAACFGIDDGGVYWFADADLFRFDPSTGTTTTLVRRVLGDCPVPLGDRVYWNERRGTYAVPRAGGEATLVADLKRPQGLVVHDGGLYACVDDVLTHIDPTSGEPRKVRSYCRPDGLAVTDAGHWFRVAYYEGWPAEEKWRVAEVTSSGVSWLYDGLGVSPVVVADGKVVWFGRPHDGPIEWSGYAVPLP
ncbi:MAG: hypothetical protein KC656_05655 [Myxococcales bacterium]|nr:hypothetical protein [Myxococcales bacterium]